ncbi:MFS transporter [Pontiellaceae bacterium B12219]|nr:MFS transporter [Pontiellaceae bacterium B12219]
MNPEIKRLWLLRICSFIQVCTLGLFTVFEAVHMRENGISAGWVGIIMAIENGLLILTGPMWGRLADKTSQYKRILILGVLGLSVGLFWFAYADSVGDFMIYALLRGVFLSSTAGILPALAIANLQTMGKGKGYGGYRPFGSIGFMTMSMVFPLIFGGIKAMAVFSGCLLPLSIWTICKLNNPEKPQKHTPARWNKMPREFYIFMAASFFSFLAEPGIHGFFSAYAKDLGASLNLVGYLSGLTGFLALISLPMIGRWVDSRGVKWILFISFFAQPLRLLITSFITTPEYLWIPHLLHIFGWAGKEVATIVFLSNLVGARRQATALTLHVSLRTAGMMTGSLMMGYLVDTYTYSFMFQLMAAVSGIGFLLLFCIKDFESAGTLTGVPEMK